MDWLLFIIEKILVSQLKYQKLINNYYDTKQEKWVLIEFLDILHVNWSKKMTRKESEISRFFKV